MGLLSSDELLKALGSALTNKAKPNNTQQKQLPPQKQQGGVKAKKNVYREGAGQGRGQQGWAAPGGGRGRGRGMSGEEGRGQTFKPQHQQSQGSKPQYQSGPPEKKQRREQSFEQAAQPVKPSKAGGSIGVAGTTVIHKLSMSLDDISKTKVRGQRSAAV